MDLHILGSVGRSFNKKLTHLAMVCKTQNAIESSLSFPVCLLFGVCKQQPCAPGKSRSKAPPCSDIMRELSIAPSIRKVLSYLQREGKVSLSFYLSCFWLFFFKQAESLVVLKNCFLSSKMQLMREEQFLTCQSEPVGLSQLSMG